ncbi:ArsR/SmtB family transcription factor [Streptomyces sp. NPDC048172]|uniref:ArsR/SmtB family transcription factor n=1 Tax=Streptomyces sp. NPDC048172 TaxID=3365505 RepID=UPI00370FD1F6
MSASTTEARRGPGGPEAGASGECEPTLACSLLERGKAERLAGMLKAIADPTRLQLLHLIQSAPGGEACVCDLTACLGLRQPTVSHHLKLMTDAGLLTRERRATWVWYAVDPEGLAALRNILPAPAVTSV